MGDETFVPPSMSTVEDMLQRKKASRLERWLQEADFFWNILNIGDVTVTTVSAATTTAKTGTQIRVRDIAELIQSTLSIRGTIAVTFASNPECLSTNLHSSIHVRATTRWLPCHIPGLVQ